MRKTILILTLLASGAAASAHAEQAPAAAKSAAPATAPQAPQPRKHRLNEPLTADQARSLMCPRWNCDDTSHPAAGTP